jgi:hypothetical protein
MTPIIIGGPFADRKGGIVGAMIISGCSINHDSRWAEPLCHNWLIACAWRVLFYPCKGSLGFFTIEYPHEVRL